MKRTTAKLYRLPALLSSMLLLLLTACSDSKSPVQNEARAKQIEQQIANANELLAAGNTVQAIAALEVLSQRNPNHPDILEALAFGYAAKPDPMLAAFYFEQVSRLAPERTELLPYAAKAYASEQRWQDAAQAYSVYLEEIPGDVSIARELAAIYTQMNLPDKALEAYSSALQQTQRDLTAEEATRLANLYRQNKNSGRAQEFYRMAYKTAGDETPLAALAALFESAVARKDFAQAETLAQIIQTKHSDAFEKLPSVALYNSLLAAREAAIVAEKQRQEAIQKREEEARLQREREEAERKRKEAEAQAEAEEAAKQLQAEQEAKAQETAEKPQAAAKDGQPKVADLLAQAEQARNAGEDARAIELNWLAVNREPENGEAWFQLSRSYIVSGQLAQAEATILEAMRIETESVLYRLNYLSIIQASKPPARFMQELEKAYEDMPQSPDIVLQAARGYDRIYKNKREAHRLYTEFIRLAPNHPQRADAEQAIRNLYN